MPATMSGPTSSLTELAVASDTAPTRTHADETIHPDVARLARIAAELHAALASASPKPRLPEDQRDIDRAAELAAGLFALANSA